MSNNLAPLCDIIRKNLDILFVGTSPGRRSSKVEHYFAGDSNVFWKLLFESGLTSVRLTAEQDSKMFDYNYGLTDIVKKPTTISSIQRRDTLNSIEKLNRRISKFSPKVVAFVGKRGWQIYNKAPRKIYRYGYQHMIKNTHLYLLPSSSGQSYRDTKYCEKLMWYTDLHNYIVNLTGTRNCANLSNGTDATA